MRPQLFALLALVPLVPLGACTTLSDAVVGPSLTPITYPASPAPQGPEIRPLTATQPTAQPASANSLWRTGARSFFNDQRASRIGDILTVAISIDDSANTKNSTSITRQANNKFGLPHLFGLEGDTLGKLFPQGFDAANAFETNSATGSTGNGAVTRAEKINLTIAAVVTQVLPNGNMVIQGTQEVKTNNEMRQLTISGIVRPEDISATNTIKHTQIAEARIAYGGRGDVSRVQKTPVGQALIQAVQPF